MSQTKLDWQERIKIWQGLENFRQVLLDLLAHNITKINQASLDKLFSGYGFKHMPSRKETILNEIDKQIEKLGPGSETAQELAKQKEQLAELEEDVIILRETEAFSYEYVLKSKNQMVNLFGFVKITSRSNAGHRAVLSWQQDSRDPILFLAELIPDKDSNPEKEKVYFQVNLGGEDGLAIIEESETHYRWTQCMKHDYPDLVNAEYGSVVMDKESKEIVLEDGNIAAATALSKAQTQDERGVTVLENNIALMNLYKNDLQNLDFNY